MCRYNLAVDDALMDEVRPHIDKDVAVQSWLEEFLHKALLSYAAQFVAENERRGKRVSQQVKALGDTPEGFFKLHTVLRPSSYTAEELRDEYITEKYGV